MLSIGWVHKIMWHKFCVEGVSRRLQLQVGYKGKTIQTFQKLGLPMQTFYNVKILSYNSACVCVSSYSSILYTYVPSGSVRTDTEMEGPGPIV